MPKHSMDVAFDEIDRLQQSYFWKINTTTETNKLYRHPRLYKKLRISLKTTANPQSYMPIGRVMAKY